VELTRQADARVKGAWLDPTGTHVLACVKSSSSSEVLYVHSSWSKPRAISKLKGLPLCAVGWQKQLPADNNNAAAGGGGGGGGADDPRLACTG
jgi:hypothetical protein